MSKRWFSSSILSGSVLIASGAIGAGMFSLPLVAAQTTFSGALLGLLLIWLATLVVTLLLAKLALDFPIGASFDSIVGDVMGARFKALNNLAVWFIFAILLYAYFTAGGGILKDSLMRAGVEYAIPLPLSSLLFGMLIAALICSGSRWVAIVCSVLLVAMSVSFGLAVGSLMINLDPSLLNQGGKLNFEALGHPLPYFVTAFACGGLVPSLVKHYQGDKTSVLSSIKLGTFIAFLVYVIWLLVNFATLTNTELLNIAGNGGSVAELSAALQTKAPSGNIPILLGVFSHLAITTSFLGIALGLFDFIADRFAFGADASGRMKTAALTFGPPAVLSMLYPKGFLLAIGYAGIVVLFSFFLLPVFMAVKRHSAPALSVPLVVVFALVIIYFKL